MPEDALYEGLDDGVAFVNGDLMAVLRIDDDTCVAAAGLNLRGQLSSLLRAGAVVQAAVEDQHLGVDSGWGAEHGTRREFVIGSSGFATHRFAEELPFEGVCGCGEGGQIEKSRDQDDAGD